MLFKKKYKILYSTFTWVVTYNCNFRCPYCFEGREKKDGDTQIVFTKEQVDIAFRTMEKIQPRKELRRDVITLYGGEPLLPENREIIEYIVQKGTEKGYKFIAITNGYSVDSYLELLSSNQIYKLQITVDGTQMTHDARRVHKDGSSTFDKIVNNIQLALAKDVYLGVRMNIDRRNMSQYNILRDFFKQKGFFDYKKFYFYPAILENSENVSLEQRLQLDFIDDKTFFNLQNDLSHQITTHYIYSTFMKALKQHKPITFRSVSCAAQVNGYVLDPLGNIYPCWDTIGDKRNIIGHYTPQGVMWNNSILDVWQNTNVGQLKPCYRCRYALLCGGGCPYRHINKVNTHCKLFEDVLKTAINKAYENFIGSNI